MTGCSSMKLSRGGPRESDTQPQLPTIRSKCNAFLYLPLMYLISYVVVEGGGGLYNGMRGNVCRMIIIWPDRNIFASVLYYSQLLFE